MQVQVGRYSFTIIINHFNIEIQIFDIKREYVISATYFCIFLKMYKTAGEKRHETEELFVTKLSYENSEGTLELERGQCSLGYSYRLQ